MRKIPFMKMSGSGNDFILIDNRRRLLKEDHLKELVSQICRHHLSVGADGVILIEPSRRADFKWRLFNADGSEAEFSGNGGRCAARFAVVRKIAPRSHSFETLAGLIRAQVKKDSVKIQFPEIKDLRLNLQVPMRGQSAVAHYLNTGVPHLVLYVENVDQTDVVALGRELRHHPMFQPAGANVNFLTPVDSHTVRIRTYERGVEEETLACGSGSVAAALITGALGQGQSPLTILQRSGKALAVYFQSANAAFSDVFLEGDAMIIYEGQMWDEAWR